MSRSLSILTLALTLCACTGDRSTAVAPQFSAAGAGAKGPKVNGADPNYAYRGDVNDVITITGSGFTPGATVAWERNGVVDPKITVLSSSVTSSTTISANISVAADAALALYDISVTADGKKGIGTDAFAVKTQPSQPDTTSIWSFETIMSDGVTIPRITDDRRGAYQNGVCGVTARLYVEQGNSNTPPTGDALLAPEANWSKGDKCTKRVINVDLSTGALYNATWTNAKHVGFMANVGDQQDQAMRWVINLANCDDIVFGDGYPDAVNPGVTVTRLPDVFGRREWNVESKAPHVARCRKSGVFTGVTYTVPFRVRVTQGVR